MKQLFTLLLVSITIITVIGCGNKKACLDDCDKAFKSCNANVEAKYPVAKRMTDKKVTTSYVMGKSGCVATYNTCKATCNTKK